MRNSEGSTSLRAFKQSTRVDSVQAQGEISFTAQATDDQAVDHVDFYVDNELVWTDSSYPYAHMWYTDQYAPGSHTLKVTAFDKQGNSASSSPMTVAVLAPRVPRSTDSSVVSSGRLPAIQPIINATSRDVSITVGHDKRYYMVYTGASNDAWFHNEGVNMWVSSDLEHWQYLGLVWSFERDGTANDKAWTTSSNGALYRVIWAPEIYYTEGAYYLFASKPGQAPGSTVNTHTNLYRSSKPEGPYVNAVPNGGSLFSNIDGSMFTDPVGKSWLCYEMNSTLTGTVGARSSLGQGDEGGFLFKIGSKYYLSVAKFMPNRYYSSYIGVADAVLGPYNQWHEALPTGGHNTYFFDPDGNPWGTYFGNDGSAPWRESPGVVKMSVHSDGTLAPAVQPTWNTVARLPHVSLFAPGQGQHVAASPIVIRADASGGDFRGKKVTLVEFFDGVTKLGEDTSAPFSFSWANPAAGSHTITARATQTGGQTNTSSAVSVSFRP